MKLTTLKQCLDAIHRNELDSVQAEMQLREDLRSQKEDSEVARLMSIHQRSRVPLR